MKIKNIFSDPEYKELIQKARDSGLTFDEATKCVKAMGNYDFEATIEAAKKLRKAIYDISSEKQIREN